MTKKFRVWDSVGKRWMDTFEVNLLEHDYLNNSEYPVQQWTGLTDSKGVEIYEGDIVSGEFYDQEYHAMTEEASKVVFVNGMFNIASTCWFKPSLKIIGNIFQTPELLEKC